MFDSFNEFLLWERSSRDTVDVKRCYIDMAGDLVTGVVLSQIVYYYLPGRDGGSKLRVEREGHLWLAKRRTDWWDECRVTAKQADRAILLLEKMGLVETRLWKFDGAPVTHVRLMTDRFLEILRQTVQDGPGKSILTFGENPIAPNGEIHIDQTAKSLTETTTETTNREESSLPSTMEGNAGAFARAGHDASPQGSEREVEDNIPRRVKVVEGEWNDLSGESEPSGEITPNAQPSAPNEFYHWQTRLLEATNPVAIMVEFIDHFYPRQIRTWKEKGVNPFTAVGRLHAQKNPNALPDWKTAMKYLWRAFAEQPDEDLVSYTQRLWTRERARLRNSQGWSDGSANGPREL
ncbi:MAG: hypothetical protein HY675_25550 [Chloroflexi bacterium]|nr:hypothetical protein [Chloroflexota bacterium]